MEPIEPNSVHGNRLESLLCMQYDLNLALNTCTLVDEVLTQVAKVVLKLKNLKGCAVYLPDPRTGEMYLALHQGVSLYLKETLPGCGTDANQDFLAEMRKPCYGSNKAFVWLTEETQTGNKAIKTVFGAAPFFALLPVVYHSRLIALLVVAADMEAGFTDLIKLMLETVTLRMACALARIYSETALNESRERMELALLGGDLAVWDWDYQSGVVLSSDRLYQMIGYYEEEFHRDVGSLYKLIHPADRPEVQAALEKHIRGKAPFYETEYRIQHKSGDWFYILARGKIMERDAQNKPLRLCGVNIDINKRKKLEAELRNLATTDVLTGIFNRRHFSYLLEKEIKSCHRYQSTFSLIMFDIDRFKRVNDTYGHDVGDEVLKNIVSLIKKRVRKTDYFARWGGEEFVVLLPHTTCKLALVIAESMRQLLAETLLPRVGQITASFGVTSYKKNEASDTLLKRVDALVYQAKSDGRNLVRGDSELEKIED